MIADIPGLIAGAHEGRGLGLRFLRHVERTRMLVQIIDMAGVDGRDPLEDYQVILEELRYYSEAFQTKERLIIANKMDIPEAKANLVKFKASVKEPVLEISAVTGEGLRDLEAFLFKRLYPQR